MAARWTLPIDQGSSLRFTFTVSYDTGQTNSGGAIYAPYNFSGCTARMEIRERPGASILVSATTEDGGLTLGGTAGTVAVYLTDEKTDNLTLARAKYDIEVTFPSGDVKRVLEGAVVISSSITGGV